MKKRYEAVVIGTSAGGLGALSTVLGLLPQDFRLPVLVVQHRATEMPNLLEEVLSYKITLPVLQADEKQAIEGGRIYCAPGGYHLLVESDRTFSLSVDAPVKFSRPSIDVLFESAADVFGPALVGIILTGASSDGADGIKKIRRLGGTTIAQDPTTAQFPLMPQAAIDTGSVMQTMSLHEIAGFLIAHGTSN